MASFGTGGRFGGRVKSTAKRARRTLTAADQKRVRNKLRAAAYTQNGVDWALLFHNLDRDNSGEIGVTEFRRLLRSHAKIPVSQLSDVDVKSFVATSCIAKFHKVIKYSYEKQRDLLPQLVSLAIHFNAVPVAIEDDLGSGETVVFDATETWNG